MSKKKKRLENTCVRCFRVFQAGDSLAAVPIIEISFSSSDTRIVIQHCGYQIETTEEEHVFYEKEPEISV